MQSSEENEVAILAEQRLRPTISVVIPSYNCASFLVDSLESVFAQTLPVLDVIVVDDGSTDDTAVVVQPYLDRITYIKQANKGLPGARNTGLSAAKGSYIALLDADDLWVPTKLEQQMPRFADSEVGIVYSDFAVRYADGGYQDSYLVNRPLAAEGFVLESYVQSRFLFPSTMVFRTACFEQVGQFDEEMLACEDVELFSRMCLHWRVARIESSLMIRYEGSHNITSNNQQMSDYMILALQKLLQKEPDLPRSTRDVVHRELARQHSWAGAAAYKVKEMRRARRHLLRALRYDASEARSSAVTLAATFLPSLVIKILRGLEAARKTG